MKIVFNPARSRYEAESSYEERLVPKQAGFRWDPQAKTWWTDDQKKAGRLAEYSDDDVRERLEAAAREHAETLAASRATDADVDIPAPAGLEYLPFQRAGIAFAAKRAGTLIGDEMGLGKTIQALGVINLQKSARVLVICPAFLRLNWAREAERWLIDERAIMVVDPKVKAFEAPPADVPSLVIIGYEGATKHASALQSIKWDLLVVDESHRLKNGKAKRTQAIFGFWSKTDRRWVDGIRADRRLCLTGTPILNRPSELWTSLKALDPQVWRSKSYFERRYCDAHQTRWGWDNTGATNLEELNEKLRTTVLVRRLKSEVLTELPAKRRQVVRLPANGASRAVKAEASAYEKHEAMLAELRAAVELAKASDDPGAYEAAVKALGEGAKVAFADISRVRHETAVAKVPHVVAHLEDVLETGHKVVLFGHHKDVLAAIADSLPENSWETITGDVAMDDRDERVARFQTDDECQIILGTIGAMGVGLTLTAASHVIFAELDWVPGNVTQAEDRCHRIGQTEPVLVQHIVLEGSLDARMADTIVDKQQVQDAALDDDVASQYAITIPEDVKQAAATAALKREQVEAQAAELGADLIAAVHEGLQILAGVCDGALELDDAGFNRLDTRIGKSLAMAPRLTAKQAVLGRKLLYKYHRQLPERINETIRDKSEEAA